MFMDEHPVSNNSVVVADSNNQIGTLYCSSGSRISNIGHWLAPNQIEITEFSTGPLTVVRGGGNFPSYVALQLRAGSSLAEVDQGVYTCIIQDENGVQQTLFVGVYNSGFYGKCQYRNKVCFTFSSQVCSRKNVRNIGQIINLPSCFDSVQSIWW